MKDDLLTADEQPRIIPISEVSEERTPWWIVDILPSEGVVYVAAQAKHGKSILVSHMALCLTTGKKFLSKYEIIQKANVIYYCLEDALPDVKKRTEYFLNGASLPKNYFVANNNYWINLPADFSKIEEDIKKHSANIIIIDTFRHCTNVKESDSDEVAPITREFRRLARLLKVTIIIVHHKGHGWDNFDNMLSWMRGSTELPASADTVIGITKTRQPENQRRAAVFHRKRSNVHFTYEMKRHDFYDKILNDRPIKDLVFLEPISKETANRSNAKAEKIVKTKSLFADKEYYDLNDKEKEKVREISQLVEICHLMKWNGGKATKSDIVDSLALMGLKGQTLNRRITDLENEHKIIAVVAKNAGKKQNATLYEIKQDNYEEILQYSKIKKYLDYLDECKVLGEESYD